MAVTKAIHTVMTRAREATKKLFNTTPKPGPIIITGGPAKLLSPKRAVASSTPAFKSTLPPNQKVFGIGVGP